MARIAYVNGRYRPLREPGVAIEDRGYQFADGVYEVIMVVGGRLRDLGPHLDRLRRSLDAVAIPEPMSRAALEAVLGETLRRNRLADAVLYIQITRGAAPRNHAFPTRARPSLIVTVRRAAWPGEAEQTRGVQVITAPDQRWRRCDIKSISLLPNVLAKQEAAARGAREAWLINEQGDVTEASASNAYIVDRAGRLITHPLTERILGGITRAAVLELARADGIQVVERPFSLEEAKAAPEAALSSTSSWLLPVVAIDGTPVGDGRPGTVVRRLMALYRAHVTGEPAAAERPRELVA